MAEVTTSLHTGVKMQKENSKPKSELGGIVVLDFGGQYTQLIARRVREQQVFSAILPCTATVEQIRAYEPAGMILSGGPSSVYDADAPACDPAILSTGIPVLGICYGMHWIAKTLGGNVQPAGRREYGRAEFRALAKSDCGSWSSLKPRRSLKPVTAANSKPPGPALMRWCKWASRASR